MESKENMEADIMEKYEDEKYKTIGIFEHTANGRTCPAIRKHDGKVVSVLAKKDGTIDIDEGWLDRSIEERMNRLGCGRREAFIVILSAAGVEHRMIFDLLDIAGEASQEERRNMMTNQMAADPAPIKMSPGTYIVGDLRFLIKEGHWNSLIRGSAERNGAITGYADKHKAIVFPIKGSECFIGIIPAQYALDLRINTNGMPLATVEFDEDFWISLDGRTFKVGSTTIEINES